MAVKDLYNSTRIADEPGGYGFNNVFSAEMYGECSLRLPPTILGHARCSQVHVVMFSRLEHWNSQAAGGVQGASRARS